MGFNRGEIRVKATNIGVMNRKGGKSIMRYSVPVGLSISSLVRLGSGS